MLVAHYPFILKKIVSEITFPSHDLLPPLVSLKGIRRPFLQTASHSLFREMLPLLFCNCSLKGQLESARSSDLIATLWGNRHCWQWPLSDRGHPSALRAGSPPISGHFSSKSPFSSSHFGILATGLPAETLLSSCCTWPSQSSFSFHSNSPTSQVACKARVFLFSCGSPQSTQTHVWTPAGNLWLGEALAPPAYKSRPCSSSPPSSPPRPGFVQLENHQPPALSWHPLTH